MNTGDELREIVKKKVKEPVAEDTKLVEAGLDSLDVLEIAFDVEDKFHIQLPQMGSEMLSLTFGDLCRLVDGQLELKHAPAPENAKA